jgi:hypothetical protein
MKTRKDFGRYCQFEDIDPKILGAVEKQPDIANDFVEQTVLNVTLDNIPLMSEHSVNTARIQAKNRGRFCFCYQYHRRRSLESMMIYSHPNAVG